MNNFLTKNNNLNKPKVYGPEKIPAVLKLSYSWETYRVFEYKVKHLKKESYVSQRIIFFSKP